MDIEFIQEHEILYSDSSILFGNIHAYLLRADTLIEEFSNRSDLDPNKKFFTLQERLTDFGKEVIGKEIHWWIYQKENNHGELLLKSQKTLDSLQKLKEDADNLKQTFISESYSELVKKIKDFTDLHKHEIEDLYEYVKWLADKDPLAPSILFSFVGWGSTQMSDRSMRVNISSIEEHPDLIKICMEISLGLRDRSGLIKDHVKRDMLVDIYDAMDPENPYTVTLDKKNLNIRISYRVLDEFEIYIENIRDSLRYIIAEIEKFNEEPLPVIRTVIISDRKKDIIRICFVQIDYSLEKIVDPIAYIPINPAILKEKIISAILIAQENSADIICFPELSFKKEWIDEIAKISDNLIVAGGTYYDDTYNVCSLIINGKKIQPSYKKNQPSEQEQGSIPGTGMKSGNIIYIYETGVGVFSILTCIDYAKLSRHIINNAKKPLDIIINPCYDDNIRRFQAQCNTDCENENLTIIQANRSNNDNGKYGNSCIISKEHTSVIEDLQQDGWRDCNDQKYLLVKSRGEQIIMIDLNIKEKYPPVSLPIGYIRRIKVIKRFNFDEKWIES